MIQAKLPIGIQDFEYLVTEGYTYVDKTDIIYQLITRGKPYFLARPRRFGKSLLVSTLHALFSGKRDLFKGLWIENSDWNWETSPIIRLDMSSIDSDTSKNFKLDLIRVLKEIAKENKVTLTGVSPANYLENLIRKMSVKQKVVVLIDEYDKPILDNIDDLEVGKGIRKILRQFYTILKSEDRNLRFIFLTGVTKFTQVSLFSGMNNPEDLSFNPQCSTLLGFTETELDKYFAKDLEALEESRELIRQWYNGYRFSSNSEMPSVYNPISMMNYMKSKRMANYWFGTGTPTFAYEMIRKQGYQIPDFQKGILVSDSIEMNHDPKSIDLITLLYQSGYLTIKSYDKQTRRYLLDFPNIEVRRSFFEHLFIYFSNVQEYQLSGQYGTDQDFALHEASSFATASLD